MAALDDSEKELVRSRTDIVALVSQYTQLRKTGSRYKACCPFHQEKTPSFHVDPEFGRWRCFGACSEGGDVFKFLQKAENLTFREALERLAERAGVTLIGNAVDREEAKRAQSERERLYAVNALALRFFRESFGRARLAQEYARKRGLTHQTMENFSVGYAPDDWSALAEYLQAQRAHLEDAEKAGLVFASRRGDGSYTDRFRGRLIFPIIDTQERIVGFGGRLLVPAENAPKYLNSPETPIFSKSKLLYALNRARKAVEKADLILIVEGYTDAVACHQAGIENVVATLGTSLTDEHVHLIRRYTRNIVLSFDADDAGARAALRAAELFRVAAGAGTASETGNLRILSLPPGEDPDSLLSKGEVAAFRKAIDSAVTVPEFRLKSLQVRYDTRTDEGKMAFLREALPIVAGVPSAIERDMLIRHLAPYHPGFTSGGSRAEESLREDVVRISQAPRDIPEGSGGPVGNGAPLSGDIVIPPRRGSAGGGFGNGSPRDGRTGYPRRPTVAPAPDVPPPPRRSAAENAERTVLRALLSEEWAPIVVPMLGDLRLFSSPPGSALAAALVPQVTVRYSPKRAVSQLADSELADFAAEITMEEDAGAPLSDEVIADCVRVLKLRQIRAVNEEIMRGQREGNRELTDEELRQWSQRSRAAKNSGGPQTDA